MNSNRPAKPKQLRSKIKKHPSNLPFERRSQNISDNLDLYFEEITNSLQEIHSMTKCLFSIETIKSKISFVFKIPLIFFKETEKEGFEPSHREKPVYTLSRGASSAS